VFEQYIKARFERENKIKRMLEAFELTPNDLIEWLKEQDFKQFPGNSDDE